MDSDRLAYVSPIPQILMEAFLQNLRRMLTGKHDVIDFLDMFWGKHLGCFLASLLRILSSLMSLALGDLDEILTKVRLYLIDKGTKGISLIDYFAATIAGSAIIATFF
jgi:hypothetical protein